MSTVSTSVPTDLSSTYFAESSSAFRFTLWVSFYVLLFLIISSSISRLCFNACATSIEQDLMYNPIKFKKSSYEVREDFKNQEAEQGSDFTFNYKTASKYQTIALTPTDEHNLMVAQVNRYFKIDNGKTNIIIDIFGNLYILGGNIYGENTINQEYRAYAYNKNNEKIDLGKLEKEPDNFYKLKIKSSDINLLNYNKIEIVYKKENQETIILTGEFQAIAY